ncbi:hypothetical protein MMC24_003350 [Lignoscripta atroalba]|nr:hypothetical protein [Lignoscripta atroalba]
MPNANSKKRNDGLSPPPPPPSPQQEYTMHQYHAEADQYRAFLVSQQQGPHAGGPGMMQHLDQWNRDWERMGGRGNNGNEKPKL